MQESKYQLCIDRLTLKFNLRHIYVKNIRFLKIINADFKYSILFELKQPNEHYVVYPRELQDGC